MPPALPPLLLHCPHCTALHWLHPCTTPCIPSTPTPTSSISETGRQTNMSQGPSLSVTHMSLRVGTSWWPQMPAGICVCVRVGDVYAVTAGGGLSFARDSTGGARIVRKLSSTVRAPPHTVLHGTLSLSPQNQPPPRPFNLFLLLLFQVSLFLCICVQFHFTKQVIARHRLNFPFTRRLNSFYSPIIPKR